MTLGLHLFQIFLPFNTSSVPLCSFLLSLFVSLLLSALSALPATILFLLCTEFFSHPFSVLFSCAVWSSASCLPSLSHSSLIYKLRWLD